MPTTEADTINADLLTFLKRNATAVAATVRSAPDIAILQMALGDDAVGRRPRWRVLLRHGARVLS